MRRRKHGLIALWLQVCAHIPCNLQAANGAFNKCTSHRKPTCSIFNLFFTLENLHNFQSLSSFIICLSRIAFALTTQLCELVIATALYRVRGSTLVIIVNPIMIVMVLLGIRAALRVC